MPCKYILYTYVHVLTSVHGNTYCACVYKYIHINIIFVYTYELPSNHLYLNSCYYHSIVHHCSIGGPYRFPVFCAINAFGGPYHFTVFRARLGQKCLCNTTVILTILTVTHVHIFYILKYLHIYIYMHT